jgi:alkanesulfonate monooxygenase SsuD/methylene tetrahydromethanopterin reductase-like flavin-dependent oxidoreductase (luciferase family)
LLFGVQTALQNTTPDELRPVWRRIEALGFEWISIWDHFYGVGGGTSNLEAVSMHAALALETMTVRCGALVYSVGYRDVAVLANAAATIDHLSHGRATLGLGAGYMAHEYDAWGVPFPSPRDRLDRLAETVNALRRLFDGDAVTVDGKHVVLRGATCAPRPVQQRLPIWIGGGGERRTIPIAGQLADGWNVPMATLENFGHKSRLLDRCAAAAGRDPSEIERTVGLGLSWETDRLEERFGERAAALAPTILSGSTDEVIERVAAYRSAGADWLFLSIRAPFGPEALDRFATEVIPALR